MIQRYLVSRLHSPLTFPNTRKPSDAFIENHANSKTPLPAFEVYDATTYTWRSLARLPAPRHHLMTAAHDGRIYALGGSERPGDIGNSGSVWGYRPVR